MTSDLVDGIIRKFGSQVAMASALGCPQSTIAHWKRRGIIPARQQQRILSTAQRLGIALEPGDFFIADRHPSEPEAA